MCHRREDGGSWRQQLAASGARGRARSERDEDTQYEYMAIAPPRGGSSGRARWRAQFETVCLIDLSLGAARTGTLSSRTFPAIRDEFSLRVTGADHSNHGADRCGSEAGFSTGAVLAVDRSRWHSGT